MRNDLAIPGVGLESLYLIRERGRAVRPKFSFWTPGRVALLLATVIGLPWLPALDPPPEDLPMHRARSRSAVPIRRLAFSPDGRAIAAINERGRVWLRPSDDVDGIEDCDLDVCGFAKVVAFSPDGRHLVIGRDEPDVVLCDLAGGGRTRRLGIPVQRTSDLRFSPDGRTLAVSSIDSGAILLWDLEAGRTAMTLEDPSSSVMTLAFSPDGRSLASANFSGIQLWDLTSGQPRHHLGGPPIYVPSLSYSPDGRLVAAVDVRGHTVRIWDVRTRCQLREIIGQSSPIHSAAFSPDGRLLVTAAGDGFASLWGVADGRELGRLDGHARFLRDVAFSPDGRTLAATGDDQDIRLWDLSGWIETRNRP